jgi:hypothetical protein
MANNFEEGQSSQRDVVPVVMMMMMMMIMIFQKSLPSVSPKLQPLKLFMY